MRIVLHLPLVHNYYCLSFYTPYDFIFIYGALSANLFKSSTSFSYPDGMSFFPRLAFESAMIVLTTALFTSSQSTISLNCIFFVAFFIILGTRRSITSFDGYVDVVPLTTEQCLDTSGSPSTDRTISAFFNTFARSVLLLLISSTSI